LASTRSRTPNGAAPRRGGEVRAVVLAPLGRAELDLQRARAGAAQDLGHPLAVTAGG